MTDFAASYSEGKPAYTRVCQVFLQSNLQKNRFKLIHRSCRTEYISILAGPTSHGKTTQLINFSLGALNDPNQKDKSVFFFSYEESRAAILSLFLNTYIGEPLSANNRESIKSYFRIGDVRYMASEGRPRAIFKDKKDAFFRELIKKYRLSKEQIETYDWIKNQEVNTDDSQGQQLWVKDFAEEKMEQSEGIYHFELHYDN